MSDDRKTDDPSVGSGATDADSAPSAGSLHDPDLRIEVERSDGTREYVNLSDALAVYERRKEVALEEIAHCDKRIADLHKKFRQALKGRVLRSGTSVGKTNPGEEPESSGGK